MLNTAGQLLTAGLAGVTLSDWTNLGGTGLNGTPSVVLRPGYLDEIFVRSGDGTIVTKKKNSDGTYPAAWSPIGGKPMAGSPSAVMDPWRGHAGHQSDRPGEGHRQTAPSDRRATQCRHERNDRSPSGGHVLILHGERPPIQPIQVAVQT